MVYLITINKPESAKKIILASIFRLSTKIIISLMLSGFLCLSAQSENVFGLEAVDVSHLEKTSSKYYSSIFVDSGLAAGEFLLEAINQHSISKQGRNGWLAQCSGMTRKFHC